jgi:hypothetical protein
MTVLLDRVSKSLYCPFPSCQLMAEVNFGEKTQTGRRLETVILKEYNSKKYEGISRLRSIDLSSRDYLMIIHSVRVDERNTERTKVIMSYPHLPRFKRGLKAILEWILASYDENGEFVGDAEESVMKIENMHGGASLAFQPVLINTSRDDDNEALEPGIRMYINSWEIFSDVTIDSFESFVEFVLNFDLHAFSMAATQIPAIVTYLNAPDLRSLEQPRRYNAK